jgi:hypothetical protein
MPVVPIGFIAIAFCMEEVLQILRRWPALRTTLSIVLFILLANLSLQWGEIQSSHSPDNPERKAAIANTTVFKNLRAYLKPGTSVVLNLTTWEDIDVMFFNNDLIAHWGCPIAADFAIYARRHMLIAVFPDHASAIPNHGPYIVPFYVKQYPDAYLLPVVLQ